MTDALQPTAPPALVYRNRPGLPGLVLKNLLLNVVTLWIYRFWAKTRWRRHIWSNVSLLGDPVEYTGTGPEMFKGFLVALAFLAPFFIVFGVWEAMVAGGGIGLWVEKIVYFAVLYSLFVAASFYARRYRLSRTRWRGVALALDAKFGDYFKFHLRTQTLNALTLFILAPRASMAIEAWLVSRTRLGAAHFACTPDWRPLMPRYLVFVVASIAAGTLVPGGVSTILDLGVPDLGLPSNHLGKGILAASIAFVAYVAYRVAMFRATTAGTKLGDAGFASDARAAPITTYVIVGIAALLAILAFFVWGLLIPVIYGLVFLFELVMFVIVIVAAFILIREAWIAPWIVDHIVNSVTISNPEALTAIAAGTEDALTRGEGLADSFDVGIG